MSHCAFEGGSSPILLRSVSTEVFAELRDAILTGRVEPGATLPSERELAATFAAKSRLGRRSGLRAGVLAGRPSRVRRNPSASSEKPASV